MDPMMRLGDLIDGFDLQIASGDRGVELTDLTDDSRQVRSGCFFVARSGAEADGADYIADAVRQQAAAILTTRAPPDGKPPVPWVRGRQVDQALAGELAQRFFGHPADRLRLVGVTGTNGKTTTAFLIQHLLREVGVCCGLIGTILTDDGQQRREASLTTPGPIETTRLLAAMVGHGCSAAVLEVSSHALCQNRTAALSFVCGVFTNLSGDHLDYHSSMDDYAASKAKLFEQLGEKAWAVINQDDPFAHRMVQDCRARVVGCTMGGVPEDPQICHAAVLSRGIDHSRARFDGPWGSVEVRLPLVGRYNVYNALQAIAAANTLKSVSRQLRSSLGNCPQVPGRLEAVRIDTEASSDSSTFPTVLVDYAHTHDALENVLLALRPLVKGRLIVLFGCGGDRDPTKRPKMARVACRLGDRIVITSDNPRREDPAAIVDRILTGVPDDARSRVHLEIDRSRAIKLAIEMANPDDTVLLAGKGHENYQIISDGAGATLKHHFDDREHAKAALRR